MIKALQKRAQQFLPQYEISPTLARIVAAVLGGLFLVGWVYFLYMDWATTVSSSGLPHAGHAGHHDHAAHAVHDHGGLWTPPQGNATPWSAFDFAMLFVMWVMMMLAMMLPAVVPFVYLFARIRHQRITQGQMVAPVFVFVMGYLLAWSLYSVGATVLQWWFHTREWITAAMEISNNFVGGAILLLAGAYQWTSLKDACLKHCHTPMGYLLTNWRDGHVGAVRMGLGHGLFCVGCCWALMLVMLVVGMMNVLWLLALTIFIFLEKTLIPIRSGRYVTGMVMLVWGGYWVWQGALEVMV